MREQVFETVRAQVGELLGEPTAALDPKALYERVQQGIASESAARDAAAGARSTLLLNGLLAAELTLWTRVFGMPRRSILGG